MYQMHFSIFTTDDMMSCSVSLEFDIVAQCRDLPGPVLAFNGRMLIWWHLPECTSNLLLAWGSCVSSPCHGVIRPYTGYAVCSLKSPFQNHKLQNNVVLEV